ncbi:MAG: hypothetical protein QOI41_3722 [Myxococcales bacterium]|nr:hypothetical protein [Myxococcales bacterium]
MKHEERMRYTELVFGFQPPTVDFASRSIEAWLASAEPWEVLVGVQLSCRAGDFSQLTRLRPTMEVCDEYLFWSAASTLAGCAGTWDFLERDFLGRIGMYPRDLAEQRFAAECLGYSCDLRAIPWLLRLHQVAEDYDPRYDIEHEVEALLAEYGPPTEDLAFHFDQDVRGVQAVDRIDYFQRVCARANVVLHAVGGNGPVSAGQRYDVSTIARRILDAVRAKGGEAEIDKDLRLFEAATAIDCWSLMSNDSRRPVPQRIVPLLESFLATHAAKYLPGQRYFFGHPIGAALPLA